MDVAPASTESSDDALEPADRRRSRFRRWLPQSTVVVIYLAIVAWHAAWLERFRTGFPLDTDEMGYMLTSFGFADALAHPAALWSMWTRSIGFGPLVPLVSSPITAILGRGYVTPMLVQMAFLAMLAAASYGLGRRWSGSPWIGTLAATVAMLTPGVVDFSRTFHFVVAATATFMLVIWTYTCSNELRRFWWAAAFGVSIALMILTRSMMLAYLVAPAILSAAALISTSDRRRTLQGLRISFVSFLAVAGSWYWYSWRYTYEYLTGFGYGAASANYGVKRPITSLGFWMREIWVNVIERGLYLPLTLLCFSVLVIAFTTVLVRRRAGTRTDVTTAVTITLVIAAIYVVLSSSRNAGTGFGMPYVVLLAVASVTALQVIPVRVRGFLATLFALLSLVTVYSKSNLPGSMSEPRRVHVPTTQQYVLVLQPRGNIQSTLEAAIGDRVVRVDRRMPKRLEGWLETTGELDRVIVGDATREGVPPMLVVGSRHPLLNSNAIGLASAVASLPSIAQIQFSGDASQTARAYGHQLDDLRTAGFHYLLTQDDVPYFYPPAIRQSELERAAREHDFTLVESFPLPDGTVARLWRG